MSLLDKALVGDVLDEALASGGDFAEVFVENKKNEDISMSERQVKNITSTKQFGVGVRIFSGEFQTYAYTNVLTRDNLLKTARKAAQAIKQKSTHNIINLNNQLEVHNQNSVSVHPLSVAKKQKIELLSELSNLVYAHSNLICKAAGGMQAEDRQILVANSEGLWAEDSQIRSRFRLEATALRDEIKEQTGIGFAKMCGYELLDDFPDGKAAFAKYSFVPEIIR